MSFQEWLDYIYWLLFHRHRFARSIKMALSLTISQKCGLVIEVTPSGGRLDDVPQFTQSDGAILSIVPAPDGLSAEIFAMGVEGTSTVTATVHAGGVTLSTSLDVVVTRPVVFATAITIVPGTPQEQ